MLVFPHWRTELPGEGCRTLHWAPPKRFAPYIARPLAYRAQPPPPQIEDDDSSGSSSPERPGESWCQWRGCGARCGDVAQLSAHVARTHAHPHSDGLFYCGWKTCARPQRGFNARYKMLVHVRTHTNERPHTCNQCNKSFSRAENLKIHLRSHSGEKPYVCPYEGCGKAYSNSSDRFKHTRTHTVDKPYCCKVPGCNKRYTDPSSLRKHVKTYKHFMPKDTKQESSDEAQTAIPPFKDNGSCYQELESTRHLPYHSPPISPVSYSSLPSVPVSAALRYPPQVDQVSYLRPVAEPLYPRVPSYEMSYLEYTQMYEHAYRRYYSMNGEFPVFRPTVCEKYAYDDVTSPAADPAYRPMEEDMPLNLKCSRLECKPVEDLVRRTDLPLDLSTKS